MTASAADAACAVRTRLLGVEVWPGRKPAQRRGCPPLLRPLVEPAQPRPCGLERDGGSKRLWARLSAMGAAMGPDNREVRRELIGHPPDRPQLVRGLADRSASVPHGLGGVAATMGPRVNRLTTSGGKATRARWRLEIARRLPTKDFCLELRLAHEATSQAGCVLGRRHLVAKRPWLDDFRRGSADIVGRRVGRNGAGMISWPRCGAQVRQRPSALFQQLPHVYWRQVMQKLKVAWNASSWCGSPRARLVARRGHGLVERRVVAQDEFFSPSKGLDALSLAPGARRTRTCSACRSVRRRTRSGSRASAPGARGHVGADGPPNGARVYRRASSAPLRRGYPGRVTRMVRSIRLDGRSSGTLC